MHSCCILIIWWILNCSMRVWSTDESLMLGGFNSYSTEIKVVHPLPIFLTCFLFWFVVLCFILYVKVIQNKQKHLIISGVLIFMDGKDSCVAEPLITPFWCQEGPTSGHQMFQIHANYTFINVFIKINIIHFHTIQKLIENGSYLEDGKHESVF